MENPAGCNPTVKRSDDNSTANQEDKIFFKPPYPLPFTHLMLLEFCRMPYSVPLPLRIVRIGLLPAVFDKF